MQLKQKSYPFEYVLAAWFFLQILPFYTLPHLTTFITFLILISTKYYLETFRFNYAIFFIVQAFVLFSTSFGWRFAAVLATIFAIRIFPVYEYPATTGRHRVGYKSLEYNEDLDMAIFYPTSEHDPARNQVFDNYAKVSARNYYGFKLIVTRYLPVILPKFLVDLAHTFYKRVYLNVTADAEIVRQDSEHKFPVILFSHGLGSYKHLYSIYFREWASHGFIVFSADHDEEIFKRWKKYEEFVDVRRPQLEVRTQTIRNLLDYIHNENNLRKLFNTDIKIDHDKVFLAGHSFGSATSASLATTDNRVTGGLVLLDPWMDPCSETVFTTAIRKPILIVRSNQFDGMEQIKENVTRFLHVNNQTTFSGYFQDTTHNDVTDFILTKPKNLEHALGCIGETDKEYRERKLLLHVSLVNLFLKLVCEEKDKPRSNVNLVEELKRRLLSLLQAYGRDEDFYFDV